MNLKGHNGKVKQVLWNNEDTKLISCGMDGGKTIKKLYSSAKIHFADVNSHNLGVNFDEIDINRQIFSYANLCRMM
jgi:hypothetical protein